MTAESSRQILGNNIIGHPTSHAKSKTFLLFVPLIILDEVENGANLSERPCTKRYRDTQDNRQ